MVEMRNIIKTWPKNRKKPVLSNVSLSLKEGRVLGLMGTSGCGKTTLARILLFLEASDSGEILYDGQRINPKDKRRMKQYRKDVQYISQNPESFFDPAWKLGKSVIESAKIHHMEDSRIKNKIQELLAMVKLNDAVLDRYPYQVSGGEIQRAALVRALLLDPRILILDEATSMLDVSVQAQILNILKRIQREQDIACLFISHDHEAVSWFADDKLILKEGKVL